MFALFPFFFPHENYLAMLHLFLCFSVWTLIFIGLFWRLVTIIKQAIDHLQRLHQIPCHKCTYFTGDYRLKCTVNPTDAMLEQAIGCRDFQYDNQRGMCNGCHNQCDDSRKISQYSNLKAKFSNLLK